VDLDVADECPFALLDDSMAFIKGTPAKKTMMDIVRNVEFVPCYGGPGKVHRKQCFLKWKDSSWTSYGIKLATGIG
jgi:hypothetical protein